jgi:hypothetical protein
MGKHAHNDWHFTDPERGVPPSELKMFIMQEDDPPWVDVLIFLAGWLPTQLLILGKRLVGRRHEEDEEKKGEGSEGGSTTSTTAARAEAVRKRLLASAGLLGTYVIWAIFSWFIFVCACVRACVHPPTPECPCCGDACA